MRVKNYHLSLLILVFAFVGIPAFAQMQELVPDQIEIVKARVTKIVSQEEKLIPGTDVRSPLPDFEGQNPGRKK